MINTRLSQIESNLKTEQLKEQVNESIINIKDYIITALKYENKMLQVKVEILEKRLAEKEQSSNGLDQYKRRNNLEIQGIPSTVSNEILEDKVTEIFESLNISFAKSDIEDCHRLGKSNPQYTIVNRKKCYAGLSKKLDLSVTNAEFFWTDQYICRTHKGTVMVGAGQKNFQNLYLKML